MSDSARRFASALCLAVMCVAGCGESSTDESAGTTAAAPEGDADNAVAETDAAEQPPAAADKSAKPAVATPQVPIPPGVKEEDVGRAGWVSYGVAQKPAEVTAFYQKEMTAKGWTLGRNDSKPLAGTTNMTGVVQEYTKGSEVLTVCLTEQIASEGALTMVVVMDTPVPADATQVVAFTNNLMIESPQAPDAAVAAFAKQLTSLGWTAKAPSASGGTTSAGFTKGNRSLSVNVRANAKKGSSMQIMHLAYAG